MRDHKSLWLFWISHIFLKVYRFQECLPLIKIVFFQESIEVKGSHFSGCDYRGISRFWSRCLKVTIFQEVLITPIDSFGTVAER